MLMTTLYSMVDYATRECLSGARITEGNCERVTAAIISLGGGASDVYTLNIYFSLFFF